VNDVNRFIIADLAVSILTLYSHNHTYCQKYLLLLPSLLNEKWCKGQGYNVMEGIVESLFAELLRLPKTREKAIYYGVVLSDLVKGDIQGVPKIIGKVVKILVDRIDIGTGGLDVECLKRLGEWFSYHLSNWEFIWNWKHWEIFLNLDKNSGRYIFLRESLDRLIRLTYFDRIKAEVPESFSESGILGPSQRSIDFKYGSDHEAYVAEDEIYVKAGQIQHALKNRESPETIQTIITELKHHVQERIQSQQSVDIANSTVWKDVRAEGSGKDLCQDIVRDVIMSVVLYLGSKSFSHSLNIIER